MQKENYKEKLASVTTFIFDVDGVLTDGSVHVLPSGDMIRTMSTRDGFAMSEAVKLGYNVCVISGGNSKAVKYRLNYLGIKDVYLEVKDKVPVYKSYLENKNINPANVIYIGDDLPDYEVMQLSGIAVSPFDGAEEIKKIADYVSPLKGGKGCARDIIEQTLKIQNNWFKKE